MSLHHKIYKLLRRSEKYTKTDMVYLAKGGFWLTINQIISISSAFLLSIALANLLPKEIYGQYKYIISIFSILAISTLPGMDTAVTRSIAQGNEGSFKQALKTKMKWGLLGALVSLCFAIYYFVNQNNTLAGSFAIVAFALPTVDSWALYTSYFNGKKLFNKLAKYAGTLKIISTFTIISVVYLSDNIFWLLLAFFVPFIVIRLIYLFIIKNKYKPNKNIDSQTIKYGKHLSFVGVLGSIAMQIDKVLIFHYIGAAELAIYSLAISPL